MTKENNLIVYRILAIMVNVFLSIALTLGFCISHSILTMTGVKNLFPLRSKNYRLFYSIVSVFSLGALTIFLTGLSSDPFMAVTPLIRPDANLNLLISVLSAIGIVFIVGSIIQTNPFKFIGLAEEKGNDLNVSLFYRFSRHPMYTGAILLLAPGIFVSSNLVWIQQSLIFVLYLIIGSIHEERRLEQLLDGYEVMYSRGQLFPWKRQHFNTLLGKNK